MTKSSSLSEFLRGGPYQAYTYSYPHKTAYRPLEPKQRLHDVWKNEKRDQLFLYVHIPFCEMRCGFCNLFTTVNAPETLEQGFLNAIERQAQVIKDELGVSQFSRIALGGGTPTYLEINDLTRLFDLLDHTFDARPAELPTSVETSPATASLEHMQFLAARSVHRVSMGVQSFIESEVHSVGRAQKNAEVLQALEHIRQAALPCLNIDLIFGLAHQTPQTWLYSLEKALEWTPEELFLYPLYVRPLTGIGRKGRTWDDERQELYELGRDFLLSNGYIQTSLRRFQKAALPLSSEPEYTCQLDGMVGLGCGARSYTRGLHYSTEYAVRAVGVRDIIKDFVAQPSQAFAYASHGFQLSLDEQKRRYLLQSLLHFSGLDLKTYQQIFRANALDNFPQLTELFSLDLATQQEQTILLSPAGLALSDAVGPWLYSKATNQLSEAYELK